jgi:hypothetical protein
MHGSPWSKIVGNAEGMALPTYGNRPAASNRIAQIGGDCGFCRARAGSEHINDLAARRSGNVARVEHEHSVITDDRDGISRLESGAFFGCDEGVHTTATLTVR